ncbi:hypothetical protein D9757_001483 [Collybiopsis confluens]|uniref:ASST-domain-containing protein n=1 Tax=Collybiopsis confluens TaxID=2823264 RepID=A0A8H5MFP6_9AGAR|nr:hypothetical protein D9757_001483 [Collybiopsis confluens]
MFTALFRLLLFSLVPKGGLGSVAYCENEEYESGAFGMSSYQTYNAAPFRPLQLNYAIPPAECPSNNDIGGYFFFYPENPITTEPFGMIINPNGTLVGAIPGFLRGIQKYKGKDHISVWVGNGSLLSVGHGSGHNLLLDDTYSIVANFTTVGLGVGADMHENFTLFTFKLEVTPNNTAVMTAYPVRTANLSRFGGPKSGFVYDSVVQEIDIATGYYHLKKLSPHLLNDLSEALFTWEALDHVDPSECYAAIGEAGNGTEEYPWDYFHINSVQKQDDGYLISSRYCHALYLVGLGGKIIWRMGGKNSDFTFSEGANFSWQHHARIHSSSVLSVFNNGASQINQDLPFSQGLLLNYDTRRKHVALVNARSPFNRTVTLSQGSFQILKDGESIVGWGAMPYFSLHDVNGDIKWSAQFAPSENAVASYRVFLHNWVGRPATPPSMQISTTSIPGNVTVYAWWNGATEVTAWELFGSKVLTPQSPMSLGIVGKVDFETTLRYTGEESYVFFQVVALNGNREYLGYSSFNLLSGNSSIAKANNQTVTAPPL